jgi:putative acetyltransferase
MPSKNSITIHQVKHDDAHFLALIQALDHYLATINGSANDFFVPLNTVQILDNCVVAYINDEAVGCGALKKIDNNTFELKRFYVKEPYRRLGIASKILDYLESFTQQNNGQYIRLETSKRMLNAVNFYHVHGFEIIPNFEPYVGIDDSVCFEKVLLK